MECFLPDEESLTPTPSHDCDIVEVRWSSSVSSEIQRYLECIQQVPGRAHSRVCDNSMVVPLADLKKAINSFQKSDRRQTDPVLMMSIGFDRPMSCPVGASPQRKLSRKRAMASGETGLFFRAQSVPMIEREWASTDNAVPTFQSPPATDPNKTAEKKSRGFKRSKSEESIAATRSKNHLAVQHFQSRLLVAALLRWASQLMSTAIYDDAKMAAKKNACRITTRRHLRAWWANACLLMCMRRHLRFWYTHVCSCKIRNLRLLRRCMRSLALHAHVSGAIKYLADERQRNFLSRCLALWTQVVAVHREMHHQLLRRCICILALHAYVSGAIKDLADERHRNFLFRSLASWTQVVVVHRYLALVCMRQQRVMELGLLRRCICNLAIHARISGACNQMAEERRRNICSRYLIVWTQAVVVHREILEIMEIFQEGRIFWSGMQTHTHTHTHYSLDVTA